MIHIALLLAALAVTSEVTVTNESPMDTNLRLSAAVDKQIADNLAALRQLNQLLDSGTNAFTLVKGFSVPSEVISNAVTFGAKWTNHVPAFLVATISQQPVGGLCPECTDPHPNHHVRRVQIMATYDEVWLPVIAEGRTNQILLTTTSTNTFIATNIVFQVPPPLPQTWTPTWTTNSVYQLNQPVQHLQRP